MAHTAGPYPGFRSIKRLGVFPDSSPIPIYTPGCMERDTVRVKCLAQEHNTMTRPGLEPGPLDPESSALTIWTPRLTLYQRLTLYTYVLTIRRRKSSGKTPGGHPQLSVCVKVHIGLYPISYRVHILCQIVRFRLRERPLSWVNVTARFSIICSNSW